MRDWLIGISLVLLIVGTYLSFESPFPTKFFKNHERVTVVGFGMGILGFVIVFLVSVL